MLWSLANHSCIVAVQAVMQQMLTEGNNVQQLSPCILVTRSCWVTFAFSTLISSTLYVAFLLSIIFCYPSIHFPKNLIGKIFLKFNSYIIDSIITQTTLNLIFFPFCLSLNTEHCAWYSYTCNICRVSNFFCGMQNLWL